MKRVLLNLRVTHAKDERQTKSYFVTRAPLNVYDIPRIGDLIVSTHIPDLSEFDMVNFRVFDVLFRPFTHEPSNPDWVLPVILIEPVSVNDCQLREIYQTMRDWCSSKLGNKCFWEFAGNS